MKTNPSTTPHFLRVTQALALVSGLGFCLVACGGKIEGETVEGGPVGCPPGEVCSGGGVIAPPEQPVSDASSEEFNCGACGAESGPNFESGVPEAGTPESSVEDAFAEVSFGGDGGGGPLDPPDLPWSPA